MHSRRRWYLVDSVSGVDNGVVGGNSVGGVMWWWCM